MAWDESISGCYYDGSSSPDGATSSSSKNIESERNRRKKLNERLFALRSIVPKISKVKFTYPQHLFYQKKEKKNSLHSVLSHISPSLTFHQILKMGHKIRWAWVKVAHPAEIYEREHASLTSETSKSKIFT